MTKQERAVVRAERGVLRAIRRWYLLGGGFFFDYTGMVKFERFALKSEKACHKLDVALAARRKRR